MLSAFKNFVITFLIAALVFGVGAYFATRFLESTMDTILIRDSSPEQPHVTPVTQPPETKPSDIPKPPTNVPTGTSFTMLIAITDYQPELYTDYIPTADYLTSVLSSDLAYTNFLKMYRHATASSLILLRADKERQEFFLTPLSSIIKLTTPAGEMRFGDTYGYYSAEQDPSGMRYITASVKALTGLDVNYYVKINATELDDVIFSLGSVTCNLPCSIYATESGYSTVQPTAADGTPADPLIPKGSFTIASDTVLPLFLLAEENEAAVKAKMSLLYAVTDAYCKEISAMKETRLSEFFASLLTGSLITTNLTPNTLSAEADLIKMYQEYTVKQVVYPITCTMPTAARMLDFTVPNIQNAVQLFDVYR